MADLPEARAALAPERLAEIRASLTAATPGPWGADLDVFDPEDCEIEACVSNPGVAILFTSECGGLHTRGTDAERTVAWAAAHASQALRDATFIAHAPTFIADLLTEVARLTADLATVEARWLAIVNGNREATMRDAAELVVRETARLTAPKVATWGPMRYVRGGVALRINKRIVASRRPSRGRWLVFVGDMSPEFATEAEAVKCIQAHAAAMGWEVQGG